MERMNDIEMAAQLGAALQKPNTEHGGISYCIIPKDYSLKDLEYLLPNPTRKRANVIITEADSFITYTKKHSSLDDCMIYAEVDTEASKFNLVAIINDHGDDQPKWRDFRANYAPNISVEWARWIGKNKTPMSQTDFATWLEDNMADVANVPNMPSGADILSMAIGFEANADKRLRSKINLQSGGVQFEFVEDETKETRTSMKVFERFTLGVPVFAGSISAYPLEARLKYRENSGTLKFWYELIRPDRVFKTAVNDELTRIKEATGFTVIHGKP